MKSLIKTAVMCATLTAMLTACSESKNGPTTTVMASKQMQADELIAAGEQLITPTSLHLADRAFAMSLEKDPSNKKAQFYRVFLKRLMVFRGLATNAEPLIKKHSSAVELQEYHESIEKMPNTPLKAFLVIPKDGIASNIKEEKDVQKILIQYRKAAMDFRKFIAQNPDMSLELHINPAAFGEQSDASCTQTNNSETSLEAECQQGTTDQSGTIKINTADLVVLKQMTAAEILYVTPFTSYNANGYIDAMKTIEAAKGALTTEQMTNIVINKMNLSLLDKEGLQAIRSLGADFVSAAKWVQRYQGTLCVRDANGVQIPRKDFLVKSNSLFCIDNNEEFNKSIKTAEIILDGPITIANENGLVGTYNFLAPFNKPVANLKQLAPATWSQDGQEATSYKDPTFAGLLVK